MKRNILSTLVTQGSAALMNLAILLLSSRYLGSEVVGKVSMLILGMAIIQSVNDIYTGPATIFHAGAASIRKIYAQGIVWTVFCTGIMNALVLISDEKYIPLRLPLLVLSYVSILHYFQVVLILAREKIKLYNFLNLLQPVLMAVTLAVQIFVFGLRGFDVSLTALYISWGLTLSISVLCLIPVLRSDTREKFPSFGAVLRTGVVNEMGNLAHTLSNRYNYFILGSVALVGVYSASSSLIERVWIIGGSIAPIILTRVANRQNENSNVHITLTLAKFSLGLSLLCAVVVYLLPASFFTWLLGKDFTAVRSVMLCLVPGVLCISFSTVISHYFSGLGRQRVLLYANLAGLAITLLLSYPLVSRWGMYGAAFTASASWATQAFVLTVLFWKTNKLRFVDFLSLKR
jgi:O-antigen/teichoic acid export membrane protein